MKARYTAILPTLRSVARVHGYALGFHGSGTRDLDLIAAPWVDGAAEPATLIEALRESIAGYIVEGRDPRQKPHGRLAWAIHLSGHDDLYVDVSVMPKQKQGTH
jgi:hypothetical protein